MLEGTRSIRKLYILTLVVIGLEHSVPPAVLSSYMMRVFNITLITYLCILSICVPLGLCGQNPLAQAGLWGVGAYTTANMVLKLGLGSAAILTIATASTVMFAFILGFVFFGLKQCYFISASVGLITILDGPPMNWAPVMGGAPEISDIPVFLTTGFVANTENRKFLLILTVRMLASLGIRILFHSPPGWSFMVIRNSEMAASYLGINSLSTESIAFAISSVLCGAARTIYAFLSGYLSYRTFTHQQSTMYLIIIMPGGTISLVGATIGTLVISLLQEWVRLLQDHMQFVYGTGIMISIIVQSEGIIGGGGEFYTRYIKGGTDRFTVR